MDHKYQYHGDQLIYEEYGGKKFYFFYDPEGRPTRIRYQLSSGGTFQDVYYVTNWRGDVTALYDTTGTRIASYDYDAWGNLVSIQDADGQNISDQNHIAVLNPLRYRGYYYDSESGFYYVSTRYYDPTTRRFLNADTTDILTASLDSHYDKNLFVYCDNNPIIRVDHGGEFWVQLGATIVGGLFSAGMEIGSQLASGKKLSEVNWNSVAIEGVSGAATGLLMSVGLPPSTVLSGRATINAVTSIAHSINEGDGLTNTILKSSSSATLTMVVGKSKPIGNRITKGRSGKVNNLINRLTYEPKHLKKNPITESIKNRLTRGVGRTLLKYMYHTYIR